MINKKLSNNPNKRNKINFLDSSMINLRFLKIQALYTVYVKKHPWCILPPKS